MITSFFIFLVVYVSSKISSEWIDVDTALKDYTVNIPQGRYSFNTNGTIESYRLIFSDEFNNSKRNFEQGFDKKWTAIEHRDTSNMGKHYFSPQAVQTDKGNLIITTTKPKERYRGARYLSGSVQTWNKFCFTSGFVEVKAILPGKWGIPGTWPAMWLMGNLGRAAFLESQKGKWPWSFDNCAPWVYKKEDAYQRINACGNRTDKSDPDSYPEKFGLNPHQGRGATEIDIMEAQIKARGKPAEISTSLQISPSLDASLRPPVGGVPQPGQWYQNISFGEFTRINSYYYGDNGLDSISALTQLNPDAFAAYHLYRLDWSPGPEGYLRWWLDDNFLFEIPASALNQWSKGVPPRQIPAEPSYLILSTAVSEKFSPPCSGEICDSIWPSNFTIDYVRVYQNPSNKFASIGCDLREFPSKEFISAHPVEYGMPWYVIFDLAYYATTCLTLVGMAVGIIICFNARTIPNVARFLCGSFLALPLSCAFFNLIGVNELLHVLLSILTAVIFSYLSCFTAIAPGLVLIAALICNLATLFTEFWVVHSLALGLVVMWFFISRSGTVAQDYFSLYAFSFVGAFLIAIGGEHLLGSHNLGKYYWDSSQWVFGSLAAHHQIEFPFLTHFCLFLCSLAGFLKQFYAISRREQLLQTPAECFNAGTEARSWHREVKEPMNNLIPTDDLPPAMQQFEFLFPIAGEIKRNFGFQDANIRNQVEHLVLLLTNATRNGDDPFVALHSTIFTNYHKWCDHLSVTPRTSKRGKCELSTDLCLYFAIWGESSNFRHTPEFLNFLFHQMKSDFKSKQLRPPGAFLDTVITPLYRIVKRDMRLRKDHDERRNYDDFNEFFWKVKCLQYDYRSPDEDAMQDMPLYEKAMAPVKISIANAYLEETKTFIEKRTWLSPVRAFRRIYEFHFVTFYFLSVCAFAEHEELSPERSISLVSTTLIIPFLLGLFYDLLNVYLERPNFVRLLIRLVTSVSIIVVYGSFQLKVFVSVAIIFYVPGIMQSLLQVLPFGARWLIRTKWRPIVIWRKFYRPDSSLYVGDNILDPLSVSWGYIFYWSTLLAWKLMFSYKFEISPLIQPSILLYRDHVDSGVGWSMTVLLIALQWIPFFIIYFIDLSIWNSLWVAITGTLVGFSLRIGEIRNFQRARFCFFSAVDSFHAKILHGNKSSAAGFSTVDTEILEQEKNASCLSDTTPLLSFHRRKPTREQIFEKRRAKWSKFSTAWNRIIRAMRHGDIISNREMNMLEFRIIGGYKREVFLPIFQLAGSFDTVARLSKTYSQKIRQSPTTSYRLEDEFVNQIMQNQLQCEAVGEIWELSNWIFLHVLGPCHFKDIEHVASIILSWSERVTLFSNMDMSKITDLGQSLAALVLMIQRHVAQWKKSTSSLPEKKSPQDYAALQFPTSQSHPGGMHKSASTTGLSSFSGNVPRRSRGSGVARIGSMQHTSRHAETTKVSHSISGVHLHQIREKVRECLNIVKSMVKSSDDTEAKCITDRLTWILTQERGFLWDDQYTGEQLTLLAHEQNVSLIVDHLYGLLTLRQIEAQPQSVDARRRLLYFINSLFMDMPNPPSLEDMRSWSVITPFYGEDVLYSKSDLESKQDGLDVHTLLYLQTLYKRDWQNFLERVKPRRNLWKDPNSALELRLWASLRGQTLARTVQGLMYGEAALRLLAELENVPPVRIEELIKQKFSYVVACQIYGRHKKSNDPKAADVEYLLHRFPNLRIAYIDEVRVNYCKEHSYFAVLIKSLNGLDKIGEVYRIRLPGNPVLGEGKPENQNSAIIFTRGESLQTIDMNQDGYLEEGIKMRNILQEFEAGPEGRPYTIVGLPEHIFTGSVSSLANYMALQETTFVTLGQRTLARPLRIRLHYGHPDIFNKLFFMTRGGISKASKGINLSEDIFAGYNNCLRGGSVAFPEYAKCGKGRDVGMQQIYKFEAKLAQGAAEQSLSRDVYRLGDKLDFFKLFSFYYNHVGFYLNMSFVVWTVFLLTYLNLLRSLLDLETIGGRTAELLSQLQIMLGSVTFLTIAPLLATISVERGFKAAFREVLVLIVTGGPLYFLFHIGTKWFYFGQTILAGGAKYRATGRGFVTKHSSFDELFRFYASSHLYGATEIAVALLLYAVYTKSFQYGAMTWSLWLVVISWSASPFWFNPLAFEWKDVTTDVRSWMRWMRGDGGDATQSWESWFVEENSYFLQMNVTSKMFVAFKGIVFLSVGISILTSTDPYHSLLSTQVLVPVAVTFALVLVGTLFYGSIYQLYPTESGVTRIAKMLYVVLFLVGLSVALAFVNHMVACVLAFYYFGAAIGCWLLIICGCQRKVVQQIYFVHDYLLGTFYLFIILICAALYVPGKIQTWLLYNNALSRGVMIEDILRSNAGEDETEDDSLTLHKMKKIILEQQKVISTLAGTDDSTGIIRSDSEQSLTLIRSNVSESDLSALQTASKRITALLAEPDSGAVGVPKRVSALLAGASAESGSPPPAPPRTMRSNSLFAAKPPTSLASSSKDREE